MAIDTRMPHVPAVNNAVTSVSQRLLQAQMILAQAETKQGLRAVGMMEKRSFSAAQEPANLTVEAVEYEPQEKPATRIVRDDRIELSVLEALEPVLPHGLVRGGVTCVQGSTFAALSMLVQASREGSWISIIGVPNLNYAAVHEAGIDTTKVVVVPDAQEKSPEVIAALIESTDVVVIGPSVALTRPEQRALTARARERGAHLVVPHKWEGARTYIHAERGQWSGLENGLGRLTDCSYELARTDPAGRGLRCALRNVDGQVTAVSHGRTARDVRSPYPVRGVIREPHVVRAGLRSERASQRGADVVRLERVG